MGDLREGRRARRIGRGHDVDARHRRRSGGARPSRRHAARGRGPPSRRGWAPARCSPTWPGAWRRTASRCARSSRSPALPEAEKATVDERLANVRELDDAQQLEILDERGEPARGRGQRARASACWASAWAGTTRSRPRRAIGSTPRSRSTGCCAPPTTGRGRATPSSPSTSPIGCARRSRCSVRPTSGRPRPTSRRCAPRG